MNLKMIAKKLKYLSAKIDRFYSHHSYYQDLRYSGEVNRENLLEFNDVKKTYADLSFKNSKHSKKTLNKNLKNHENLLIAEKEAEEFIKSLTLEKMFDKQIIEDFNINTILIDDIYNQVIFPFKFSLKEKNEDVLNKYTIHLKEFNSLNKKINEVLIIKYKNKDILCKNFCEYELFDEVGIFQSTNLKFLFHPPQKLKKFKNFDKFEISYKQSILDVISNGLSGQNKDDILFYKKSFNNQSYLYDEIIELCDQTLKLRVFK